MHEKELTMKTLIAAMILTLVAAAGVRAETGVSASVTVPETPYNMNVTEGAAGTAGSGNVTEGISAPAGNQSGEEAPGGDQVED